MKVKLVKHDEISPIPIDHDLESASQYKKRIILSVRCVRFFYMVVLGVCLFRVFLKAAISRGFGPATLCHPSESHVIHMTAQENQVR